MLVLSRQENQRIRFPGLGISVEILDIRGSKVKLGVDAPIEVRILRDELEDLGESPNRAASPPQGLKVIRLPREVRHELRNTLHELNLMLHVYRKRSEKHGRKEGEERISPEQMCEAIIERLNNLSEHQALSKRGVVTSDPEEGAGTTGRAMVVDDDDNERELMAGFLRMCGYKVTTAANGVDAMKLLREDTPPEVILLDMQMPLCDGQEFLQQVRGVDRWNSIHIFIVSASNEPNEKAGYSHWFQKPLDPRLVVERLNQIEIPCVA